MKQYQKIEIKWMPKTNRIKIKDDRFNKVTFIPASSGNILTDVEKFLTAYNYNIIGYSSNFETEIYTMFLENKLDKNKFRQIDKNEKEGK